MNIKIWLGFSFVAIFVSLFLSRVEVPDVSLTIDSLKRNYSNDWETALDRVASSCREIIPSNESELGQELIRAAKFKFSPHSRSCHLDVVETGKYGNTLKVTKALTLLITEVESGTKLIDNRFLVSYLLPLALLPFAIFFIALLFDIKIITPSAVFLGIFFFYSGINPLGFLDYTIRNFKNLFVQDKNLIGLCLLVFWSQISKPKDNHPFIPKSILLLCGILNPSLSIVCRRNFLRLGNGLKSKIRLLSLQSLFLMTSFTLLAFTSKTSELFLPRYFTFAFVILFLSNMFATKETTPAYFWTTPFNYLNIATILVGEVLFYFFSPGTPFVFRLAVELLSAECFHIKEWNFTRKKAAFYLSRITLLFFAALAAFYASRLGVLSLLIRTMHIDTMVLGLPFTLFAFGILSGIIFGSITIPYFFVLSTFPLFITTSVAKAGLMDGLIIGTLLSPLSIFNLYSSKDLKMGIQNIVKCRAKQLSLSVFAGAVVYLVGGLHSVKILQPVTFLFLLLVVFVNQMRLRKWRWFSDTSRQVSYNAPHST